MSSRRLVAAFTALCAVALIACSGSDPDTTSTSAPDGPPTTATASTDLAAVGLSDDRVATLGRVELTNLDVADAMGVEVWLHTEAGDVLVPLFVDASAPSFIAPMAPLDPMGGGALSLHLERDGERGPTLTVDVDALEPAPGAWQRFVDRFVAEIDDAARARRSSIADLQATGFDDVAPELIGLKLAQAYVDDGSANALAGVWDAEQLTEHGRELLDALAGAIDLESVFDVPDVAGSSESPGEAGDAGDGTGPQGFARPALVAGGLAARAPAQGGACIDPGITIADAEELSTLIESATSNTIDPNGPRRDVLDKIGTVTTVAGFIPEVGFVAAGGGAAFIALETYLNATAGMYPSALTALEAAIDTLVFPEDFTVAGAWFDVTVTARSRGWSADADVARTVLAVMSASTSGVAGLEGADGLALDASLYLRDNTANRFVADQGGVITFCAQTWNVDVTGVEWSSGEAVLDRFEVDSTARVYRPVETGLNLPVDDTLRISVDPAKFAGKRVWQDHEITVMPILLSAESVIEVAEPGEEFDVQVAVTNATDPALAWDPGNGGWRGDARLIEAGAIVDVPAVWERTHVTPNAVDRFPYLIAVEPTTSTGLRADGEPPRRHVVEVRLAELVIEPDPGSVLVNGTIAFVARGADGLVADVTWSATGGTIGPDGVYVAGNRPGTYQVTAVSVDDPNITATATVVVTEADCVVGTWRLRSQEFLDQIVQAYGDGSISYQGGEYVTTFGEDGQFRGERRAWRFAIATDGQQIGVTIDSVETGTWTLDPAGTLLQIDESDSDATVAMTLNGDPFPIGAQSFSSPSVGSAAFDCAGDVLTMTITDDGATATATLDRIG